MPSKAVDLAVENVVKGGATFAGGSTQGAVTVASGLLLRRVVASTLETLLDILNQGGCYKRMVWLLTFDLVKSVVVVINRGLDNSMPIAQIDGPVYNGMSS
jgi:hypothetical protein